MAEALGVSKGQVAKMIKAAALLKNPSILALFPDRSVVPVELAYKLAALMERPGAKEVVLKAAQTLGSRGGAKRPPAEILKSLLASLDRSKSYDVLRREYNVGPAGRVQVMRNPKGKVTLTFRTGLEGRGSRAGAGGDGEDPGGSRVGPASCGGRENGGLGRRFRWWGSGEGTVAVRSRAVVGGGASECRVWRGAVAWMAAEGFETSAAGADGGAH